MDCEILAKLEKIEVEISHIKASLKKIESSSKNMDRHITLVESFMMPFKTLLRLR